MGLVGVMQDITERKLAEEALRESEESFRRLAESAAAILWQYDIASDRWTYVAPQAARILGYPPEAWTNMAFWTEHVHPNDREWATQYCAECTAQGRHHEFEYRFLAADGRTVWIRDVVSVEMRDGRPAMLHGFMLDITERRGAREALLNERALLRTVIDNLPASVYAKDLQGRKTLANRANLTVLGVSTEEEVLGRTDRDFYPPEIAAQFEANDRQVLGTGVPLINREQGLSNGSSPRWVATSKLPLHDASGGIIGLVGITYDITDRKEAERERLETERQLLHTQKLESLGMLAGGVAHDLGNLLMAILGNLTLVLTDLPPDAAAREGVMLAIQAGQRAADVARQMLTYSGRGQFDRQPVSLSQVVQENAHILRVAIPKNVTLTLALDHDVPVIEADAGQMQQLAMNLITNASEAIEEHGNVVLRTGVQTCDDAYLAQSVLPNKAPPGHYVYIEVSDTGCGMEPETMRRIFEPFFTTKAAGRGLGMAAVQGIVTGHKGAIMVSSIAGQGTSIRLLFPVARAQGSSNHRQEVTACASVADKRPSPAPGNGMMVLVVDDEEIVRQAAQKMLHRLGYRTLAAANGEQALAVYLEHAAEIDCVLLDLTMPRMDGASTFAALHELAPELPVVLCSGYCEHETEGRLDRDSLAGFIQKPYTLDLLSEIMTAALETRSG